jgi:hypothetical protein
MVTKPHPSKRSQRASIVALALLLAAFAFLARPAPSPAVEYHTNCVGHGWVAGASPSDGSAFSRIETGCGSTARECKLYNWGVYLGSQTTTTTTCNAWLMTYGNYTECASYAKVNFPAQWSEHNHTPDGYCGAFRMAPLGNVDAGDEPLEDSPDVTPAGAAVIGATAPDPDGGPDFAVRVYRSEAGQTCPEAGRTSEGRFGTVWPGEGFVELELASAGACADLDEQPVGFAVSDHPAVDDVDAHAVLFGSVADGVTAVSVVNGGRSESLEIVSGTFILPSTREVLDGAELIAMTGKGDVTYDVTVGEH